MSIKENEYLKRPDGARRPAGTRRSRSFTGRSDEVLTSLVPVVEAPPGVHHRGRHGLPGGAGADDHVPGALGGRPGQRPRQPGLPRAVQQRHRPLQGRPAVPSRRSIWASSSSWALSRCFKNSLTGLPIGGGKGGSDFDPKGKSDREVMRFCQSFMTELYRAHRPGHRRARRRHRRGRPGDRLSLRPVQAPDATSSRGVLTGKGLTYGGSLARTEATGYGLCYFTDEMLARRRAAASRARPWSISGSGNVAIYACEKATAAGRQGRRHVRLQRLHLRSRTASTWTPSSRSRRCERGRITRVRRPTVPAQTITRAARGIWTVPCDIALPCATQNELDLDGRQGADRQRLLSPWPRAPTCPPPWTPSSAPAGRGRALRPRQGRQRRRRGHLRAWR